MCHRRMVWQVFNTGIFVTNRIFFSKRELFTILIQKLYQPLFHEARNTEKFHYNPANDGGCMCTMRDGIWTVNFATFMSS